MATGFVQRFKGKVAFGPNCFWVNGTPMFGAGSVQALSTTSASANINPTGVTTIVSASVISIFRLTQPPFANIEKTIQLTQVSSGVFITASTDGSKTFNGSSFSVLKSTVAAVIGLVATSTINWAITGTFPGSTLTGAITLSTST